MEQVSKQDIRQFVFQIVIIIENVILTLFFLTFNSKQFLFSSLKNYLKRDI